MLLKQRIEWAALRQPANTREETLQWLTKMTADQLTLHGFNTRTKPGYVLVDLTDFDSDSVDRGVPALQRQPPMILVPNRD
jgi:hypothetical protein